LLAYFLCVADTFECVLELIPQLDSEHPAARDRLAMTAASKYGLIYPSLVCLLMQHGHLSMFVPTRAVGMSRRWCLLHSSGERCLEPSKRAGGRQLFESSDVVNHPVHISHHICKTLVGIPFFNS
jgi:hypothetical protein